MSLHALPWCCLIGIFRRAFDVCFVETAMVAYLSEDSGKGSGQTEKCLTLGSSRLARCWPRWSQASNR
jgi:hypothetical protein